MTAVFALSSIQYATAEWGETIIGILYWTTLTDDDAHELVDMTNDSVITKIESDMELEEEAEGQEEEESALEGISL